MVIVIISSGIFTKDIIARIDPTAKAGIKRIKNVGLSIYSFACFILAHNIKESRNNRI